MTLLSQGILETASGKSVMNGITFYFKDIACTEKEVQKKNYHLNSQCTGRFT